jgi:hypothetical protein
MKRGLLAACWIFILLFCVPGASAQQPTLVKQLVYAMEAFDGVGYTSSFAPAREETLFLLADHPNALSPRYTMVYYWAITRSYKADWNELNEPITTARMEILRGQNVIQTLDPMVFSLSFPEGYGSRKSELLWGTEAEKGYQDYLDQRDEYMLLLRDYQAALQQYQLEFDQYQDAMLDPNVVEKPVAPVKPEEPTPFVWVVTPPSPGYQVKLEAGNYRIRLMDANGQIIPESEKKLEVFTSRRSGIGYNIIPESRWTKPERSDDPQETIYVSAEGNAALYLQPFYEDEFNEAQYRGLLDPQDHSAVGDRWIWAHMETFSGSTLVLLTPGNEGEVIAIEEKPYKVVQLSGETLGYQVVEYQPELMSGERPTFAGFKLDLTDREGRLGIRLLDTNGVVVEGSEREVRWIAEGRSLIQALWLCVPLLGGLTALLYRRSRVKEPRR